MSTNVHRVKAVIRLSVLYCICHIDVLSRLVQSSKEEIRNIKTYIQYDYCTLIYCTNSNEFQKHSKVNKTGSYIVLYTLSEHAERIIQHVCIYTFTHIFIQALLSTSKCFISNK